MELRSSLGTMGLFGSALWKKRVMRAPRGFTILETAVASMLLVVAHDGFHPVSRLDGFAAAPGQSQALGNDRDR